MKSPGGLRRRRVCGASLVRAVWDWIVDNASVGGAAVCESEASDYFTLFSRSERVVAPEEVDVVVLDGEVRGLLAVGSDSDPAGPGVEEVEEGEARNTFVVIPVVELVRGDGQPGSV